MAGIYVHIPFCKSRCAYCDFHSGTNFSLCKKYVSALSAELNIRKDYLNNESVKTIYFGGGTPTLLQVDDLSRILDNIHQTFNITECFEVTIEANPDDLTEEYVKALRKLHFNRISIGIQSFNNNELYLMNRRHSAEKAIEAVKICQKNGFENISIDLIFGLPNQTLESWENSLKQAVSLNVQHISAYHLTYEKGTKMHQMLEKKEICAIDEDVSLEMFKMLINRLENNGFEHYEISNFAKQGFRSQHNSAYWNNKKYLGIGAAAHSYDGISRQWNIADTSLYISNVENGSPFFEKEVLNQEEKYNDFIITRLRTKEGICLNELQEWFGEKLHQHCLTNAAHWLKNNFLIQQNNQLKLNKEGIFISDRIFSDLLYV